MRRRVLLAAALAGGSAFGAAALGAQASGGGPPAAAPAAATYHPGVDVRHYTFDLVLPDTGARLEGTAIIHLRRTAPVDTLRLDLRTLDVRAVRVGGRVVAARRDAARLHVPLPPGAGDSLVVAVDYAGMPRDGLIVARDSAGRWTAFGDNWPDRARHWLPTVDHPSDKATVAWRVTAPDDRRVIANGRLVEVAPAPGRAGWTRTVWETTRPIPTYLMVVGAAPWAVVELGDTACGLAERPGCVAQAVWVAPESRDFMPGPFARAGDIVAWLSRTVAPFPYEKLHHVQSRTRFGGMENATAIFYSDRAFRTGTLDEGLVAHETAHQWFGDAVTEREWGHLWLSEGFATYFTQLWMEHSRGDSAFRAGMRGIRDEILASRAVATRPVLDTAETDYLRLLNENSYEKGGFVLHMLRAQVGDSAFLAGVRDYYARHRHGTALTGDLQAAVERASGQELGWFFDQWLRRPGWAEVEVRWRHDPATRRVVADVRQGGRFAPYRLLLSADVITSDGRRERVRVEVPAAERATVALPLDVAAPPAEVVWDPDVTILGTVRVLR